MRGPTKTAATGGFNSREISHVAERLVSRCFADSAAGSRVGRKYEERGGQPYQRPLAITTAERAAQIRLFSSHGSSGTLSSPGGHVVLLPQAKDDRSSAREITEGNNLTSKKHHQAARVLPPSLQSDAVGEVSDTSHSHHTRDPRDWCSHHLAEAERLPRATSGVLGKGMG